MKGRFSKANVIAELAGRADRLAKLHRFDINNGYAQVEGRGEAVSRAYGEWSILHDIAARG